jgi:FKBP-type peptidyl-prolyl cis-trans isomerase
MKRFFVSFVLAGLVAAGTACAADPELKTDDEKTLYALGLVISNQLSPFKLTPAELDLVKAGLTDGSLKKTPKVELETYGPKIKPFGEARQLAAAAEEKKKGKAFLDTIASKPKIKKTDSGLLIETITEGTGAAPTPADKVKVNYKGTLIDGTPFDESAKHGGPATFTLNQVIKCWTEGLGLMKTGGKAKLYCPADIAYGDRGQSTIPPGSTLVFEVELLEIVK